MDQTPEQVVFGIAELVDNIFRFVDTKSLCNARQVCHNWREISKLSLKRRLQLTSFDSDDTSFDGFDDNDSFSETMSSVITLSAHEENRKLISEIPHELCLLVKDVVNPMDVADESEMTRCTTLLVTVLEQDWLGSVVKLTLDRCLTVNEWNAVGCRILNKFPVMKMVVVNMAASNTIGVLPMHYVDMEMDENDWTSSFKSLRELQLALPLTDHGEGGETTRICLDILDHCSDLFYVSVNWNLENEMGSIRISSSAFEFFNDIKNLRYECSIHDSLSRKISNTCAQTIMKDLAKFLTVTKPGKLTWFLPGHQQVSGTPSFVSAELRTVVVDIGSFQGKMEELVKDDIAEDLLSSCSTTAFSSTRKLVVHVFGYAERIRTIRPIMVLPLPEVSVIEFRRHDFGSKKPCRNAYGFPDLLLEHWMQNQLCSSAPNAKLLFVRFGEYRSRLIALEMVKNFASLKHLVLVNERFQEENLETDAADLNTAEIQCLKGLQGVTVITERSVGLEQYIRAFVEACGSVPTIRKLSVHCRRELDRDIDRASLGIVIPDNLTVETRSIGRDSDKMVLEGVEDSMLSWKKLCNYI